MECIGTILNILLKKLNNLRSTNKQDFSREETLTGFLHYYLIPLLSFLFGTVIYKSPILQQLSVMYVCQDWVWRATHKHTGKNTDLFSGPSTQCLMFSPNACRHCFTHALGKRSEKSPPANYLFYYPIQVLRQRQLLAPVVSLTTEG